MISFDDLVLSSGFYHLLNDFPCRKLRPFSTFLPPLGFVIQKMKLEEGA
jgi:hypothetical protein